MYSLTWTEKPWPCSAMYNADVCEQHREVYDNYLEAAVRYLELYFVGSSEICRVRLWQKGVGDLGKKVKTDRDAVFKYLLKTYRENPSEEKLNKTLYYLDPNRPYEENSGQYNSTRYYTPTLAKSVTKSKPLILPNPRTFGGFIF
jgi:hypothetical protein